MNAPRTVANVRDLTTNRPPMYAAYTNSTVSIPLPYPFPCALCASANYRNVSILLLSSVEISGVFVRLPGIFVFQVSTSTGVDFRAMARFCAWTFVLNAVRHMATP